MRGACCTTIWLLAVAATLAQGPKPPGPPDGKKGPPPGKGPPSYLGQMDANRDGFLELDELSERARPIIEQVVRGTGGDPRQPVPVGVVEEAVAASINRRPINADPKTRQLADELLQQFDTDGDGRIIKDEWKKLEETTGWKGGGGHRKADFDFDEEVTPAELALWITLQDPVNRGGDLKGPKPPPPPRRAKQRAAPRAQAPGNRACQGHCGNSGTPRAATVVSRSDCRGTIAARAAGVVRGQGPQPGWTGDDGRVQQRLDE